MTKKIIYIAGVGHSGSTVLDMSLSCSENVIGLGEVKTTLDSDTRELHFKSYCSCGQPAESCDFWKDFKTIPIDSKSINENYENLISYFNNKYDENSILLDSSKNSYPYLEELQKKHNLKVILITRDFRSWIYSRSNTSKTNMFKNAFLWIAFNFKIRYELKKMNIKPIIVGYEELALYPEHILKTISSKLGISYTDDMLNMRKTKSHIISGNIARMDKGKNKKLIYDARWLLSSKIQFMSVLLFFVHRFNKKQVYSNLYNKEKGEFHIFGTKNRENLSKEFN